MELKRVAKKEYFLILIALIVTYFIKLPKLEFLIYQNLHALLTFLITSLLVLITSYLTRKFVYQVLSQTTKLLRIKLGRLYTFNKQVVIRCLTLALEKSRIFYGKTALFSKTYFKRLANGAKDILDLREAVPKKESVTESLVKAHQEVRKKKFIYKVIGAILANTFIISFLIKGLKIESNSIIIPDYLEIQFLAYKTFILLGTKAFIAAQIILSYFTLQNISLAILTTSITYALSIKRFRETIKNLLFEACKAITIQAEKIGKSVSKKISEESKILQSDAKDIASKQTWPQIKKEASLFKEELSTWEAKKKLLALAAASFVIIIMISGSLNHENNLWTSFVAASAGGLCDGAYDAGAGTYRRCAASETCCSGSACSTSQQPSYYCYNKDGGATYDYDKNEYACSANWYCDSTTGGTACLSGKYTTKTGNPWTWGQATTIGYDSGTAASCCGDDASENYLTCNKEAAITWSCTSSDKGCCTASTKCVDLYILANTTKPQCYATGAAYSVMNVDTGNDRFAYCASNTWYDCDTSSANCNTYCASVGGWPLQGNNGGASSWVIGGEGAAFGEYDTGTSTECCGDDTSENYRSRECATIPSCTSAADNACCSASTDCVYANTCVTTAGCYTPMGYACDTGSFYEADTTSGYCTSCNGKWYTSTSGGSAACCGDDGTNDDFYLVINNTDPVVNDTCMFCNNGVNNSADCFGHLGCHASGDMVYANSSVCDQGPGCYCISGQGCTATGVAPSSLVEGPIPENCTTGGIYNNLYANCFTDGPGDNLNGSCRYSAGDPCTEATGLNYIFVNGTCADEGNTSVEGDAYGPYYCYCDEGCTTSGVNSTCTLGTRRPDCTSGTGVTDGGDNMACGEKDYDGTTDACHFKTGDSCANPYDGGIEGCWNFQNDTEISAGVTCTDCDSGYQAGFTNNLCYYAVSCASNGWGGSYENCFEWCWAGDLTTANCFGASTLINRTEPANATTCYVSRTCTDSVNGCGWTTSTMRQDYCDQCGPTETYNATDYCPNINASCSSNCADTGAEIWYGTDSTNRCSNTNTTCMLTKDTLTIGDVWGGNSSAAFCDNLECYSDCGAAGNSGGTCDGGVCVCASPECDQGCMFIRNSTEQNVTIFTYTGNMFITGSLLSAIGAPDGSDFIIRDSANANQAWINDLNGSLGLAGLVYQNMAAYCTPAGNAYTIKDKSENCVAYINSSGDLWLRGNLTQNAYLNT